MSNSAHGIRSQRTTFARFASILVGLSLVMTACALEPVKKDETSTLPKKTSVSVEALYARGDTGGHSTQTISVIPSPDGDFSIDISENEVSGFGDMIRAASWNAVMVATALTGCPTSIASSSTAGSTGRAPEVSQPRPCSHCFSATTSSMASR